MKYKMHSQRLCGKVIQFLNLFIGIPLYLRIEMAIPLLSILLTKGMSMGAAIALLIGGTGASLPELAILSSMLKPKGIIAFTLTVLTLAISGGILFMFI